MYLSIHSLLIYQSIYVSINVISIYVYMQVFKYIRTETTVNKMQVFHYVWQMSVLYISYAMYTLLVWVRVWAVDYSYIWICSSVMEAVLGVHGKLLGVQGEHIVMARHHEPKGAMWDVPEGLLEEQWG